MLTSKLLPVCNQSSKLMHAASAQSRLGSEADFAEAHTHDIGFVQACGRQS